MTDRFAILLAAVLANAAGYAAGYAAGHTAPLALQEPSEPICYSNAGERVMPSHEMTNLMITVHWFDTPEQVQAAVNERTGESKQGTEGYSECETYPDQNIGWCEIWVPRPAYVLGDPNMDTLGHEVLHGLMGDFHQ